MLVPRGSACNQMNSTKPLPAAWVAKNRALAAAVQQMVATAQAKSNTISARSPWDYRDMGLNVMADVYRSNLQNGAPGYVPPGSVIPSSTPGGGLIGPASGNGSVSPGQAITGSAGAGATPASNVPGAAAQRGANQGWWSGWAPGAVPGGAGSGPGGIISRTGLPANPGVPGSWAGSRRRGPRGDFAFGGDNTAADNAAAFRRAAISGDDRSRRAAFDGVTRMLSGMPRIFPPGFGPSRAAGSIAGGGPSDPASGGIGGGSGSIPGAGVGPSGASGAGSGGGSGSPGAGFGPGASGAGSGSGAGFGPSGTAGGSTPDYGPGGRGGGPMGANSLRGATGASSVRMPKSQTGVAKNGFVGRGEASCESAPVVTTESIPTTPNPPAPPLTISPISPPPVLAKQCPTTGDICEDLRSGAVLASSVSPAQLYQCSQAGYVGVHACVGLNGAYPINCSSGRDAGGSAAAAASSDSGISPWWWLLLAGLVVYAASDTGEKPRVTRATRPTRSRRAA